MSMINSRMMSAEDAKEDYEKIKPYISAMKEVCYAIMTEDDIPLDKRMLNLLSVLSSITMHATDMYVNFFKHALESGDQAMVHKSTACLYQLVATSLKIDAAAKMEVLDELLKIMSPEKRALYQELIDEMSEFVKTSAAKMEGCVAEEFDTITNIDDED